MADAAGRLGGLPLLGLIVAYACAGVRLDLFSLGSDVPCGADGGVGDASVWSGRDALCVEWLVVAGAKLAPG